MRSNPRKHAGTDIGKKTCWCVVERAGGSGVSLGVSHLDLYVYSISGRCFIFLLTTC